MDSKEMYEALLSHLSKATRRILIRIGNFSMSSIKESLFPNIWKSLLLLQNWNVHKL